MFSPVESPKVIYRPIVSPNSLRLDERLMIRIDYYIKGLFIQKSFLRFVYPYPYFLPTSGVYFKQPAIQDTAKIALMVSFFIFILLIIN